MGAGPWGVAGSPPSRVSSQRGIVINGFVEATEMGRSLDFGAMMPLCCVERGNKVKAPLCVSDRVVSDVSECTLVLFEWMIC